MNVWKPKIWKSKGLWYCSYYRNSSVELYQGLTPPQAYASWKCRGRETLVVPANYRGDAPTLSGILL